MIGSGFVIACCARPSGRRCPVRYGGRCSARRRPCCWRAARRRSRLPSSWPDGAEPGDREAIEKLSEAARSVAASDADAAADLSVRALELMPRGDEGRGPLVAQTVVLLSAALRSDAANALGARELAGTLPADQEAEVRLALSAELRRSLMARTEDNRRALKLGGLTPCGACSAPWLAYLQPVGHCSEQRGGVRRRGRYAGGPGRGRFGGAGHCYGRARRAWMGLAVRSAARHAGSRRCRHWRGYPDGSRTSILLVSTTPTPWFTLGGSTMHFGCWTTVWHAVDVIATPICWRAGRSTGACCGSRLAGWRTRAPRRSRTRRSSRRPPQPISPRSRALWRSPRSRRELAIGSC